MAMWSAPRQSPRSRLRSSLLRCIGPSQGPLTRQTIRLPVLGDGVPSGYGRIMKLLLRTLAAMLLAWAPAHAIVGGASPAEDVIGRSVVTIVGSRGNFCSGALIAPKLVLTAAHCVQPGAEYRIVDNSSSGQPALQTVRSVAIHPGFKMDAMLAHRATADVALLQLELPAKAKASA